MSSNHLDEAPAETNDTDMIPQWQDGDPDPFWTGIPPWMPLEDVDVKWMTLPINSADLRGMIRKQTMRDPSSVAVSDDEDDPAAWNFGIMCTMPSATWELRSPLDSWKYRFAWRRFYDKYVLFIRKYNTEDWLRIDEIRTYGATHRKESAFFKRWDMVGQTQEANEFADTIGSRYKILNEHRLSERDTWKFIRLSDSEDAILGQSMIDYQAWIAAEYKNPNSILSRNKRSNACLIPMAEAVRNKNEECRRRGFVA